MLLGNTRGALRALNLILSGGVLALDTLVDSKGWKKLVKDVLKDKHPQAASEDALVDVK